MEQPSINRTRLEAAMRNIFRLSGMDERTAKQKARAFVDRKTKGGGMVQMGDSLYGTDKNDASPMS